MTGVGGGPNLTMLFFFDFLAGFGGGPNPTMLFSFDFLTGSGGGPNLTMLFFFDLLTGVSRQWGLVFGRVVRVEFPREQIA